MGHCYAAKGCTRPSSPPGAGCARPARSAPWVNPVARLRRADAAAADVAHRQRENAVLARRLAVAEEIIAIQKKVSALLGIALNPPQADRYADGGRRDLGTPDRYPPQADQALDVARASYYRAQKPAAPVARTPPPTPARALDATERQAVLDVLHSERFCDAAPAEVYATLLDAGTYFYLYVILDV